MFSVVTDIFVLSCFSSLVLSVSNVLLFRVDITIPQKMGRSEIDDINSIETTLSDLAGINVIFARKFFDNQKIILGVEEICNWSLLTSALSEQGYRLSVTPLQSCSVYAMEIGVNITYPVDEVQKIEVLEFHEVVYYDEGMTTDEYIQMMEKHFKREKYLIEEVVSAVCYRALGDLPIRLMYFGFAKEKKMDKIYKIARNEGKASIQMAMVQSFQAYKATC